MTRWKCPPTTTRAEDVDEALDTLTPQPEVEGEAGTVQRCQLEAAKTAAWELSQAYHGEDLIQVFISGTTGLIRREGRPPLEVEVKIVEASDVGEER